MVEEQEKQPSRCVLVLGTGRSGTSAVGGVLYSLGVWMGDSFMGRDNTNRWGTFEDKELFVLTRHINGGGMKPEAYRAPIERRNQRPLWGWKDPGLVFTLQHALPYLEDVRAIVCHRPAGQCIISARTAYGWREEQARQWYDSVFHQLDAWITELDLLEIPTLHVAWDDLLDDTKARVKEIAAFAFDGLPEQPSRYVIGKAERHIRK